jgi:hypothetical protein
MTCKRLRLDFTLRPAGSGWSVTPIGHSITAALREGRGRAEGLGPQARCIGPNPARIEAEGGVGRARSASVVRTRNAAR